jgi:hypothetical protein
MRTSNQKAAFKKDLDLHGFLTDVLLCNSLFCRGNLWQKRKPIDLEKWINNRR